MEKEHLGIYGTVYINPQGYYWSYDTGKSVIVDLVPQTGDLIVFGRYLRLFDNNFVKYEGIFITEFNNEKIKGYGLFTEHDSVLFRSYKIAYAFPSNMVEYLTAKSNFLDFYRTKLPHMCNKSEWTNQLWREKKDHSIVYGWKNYFMVYRLTTTQTNTVTSKELKTKNEEKDRTHCFQCKEQLTNWAMGKYCKKCEP